MEEEGQDAQPAQESSPQESAAEMASAVAQPEERRGGDAGDETHGTQDLTTPQAGAGQQVPEDQQQEVGAGDGQEMGGQQQGGGQR